MDRRGQNPVPLSAVFFASCLLPLGGLAYLALDDARYTVFAGLAGACCVAGLLGIALSARRGLATWLTIALSLFSLTLAAPEVLLRVVGFRYEADAEFGYPRSYKSYPRDPDLFWTRPKSSPGVNSWGFVGPEVTPRPDGVCRVMFLGNSFLAPYASIVGPMIAQRDGKSVEAIDLTMPGYSSFQGRRVVDTYADFVEPDVVVVAFGWDDHWLARWSVDAEKVVHPTAPWTERLFVPLVRRFRTLQALTYVLAPASRPIRPRVSPDEYVDNLTAIGERFVGAGVPALFLTTPSSHESVGVPGYLVDRRFAADAAAVVELHRAYNASLRRLALDRGWRLLDLETRLDRAERPSSIFAADGIHQTDSGRLLIGREIAAALDGTACL